MTDPSLEQDDKLKEMVDRLVEALAPERIYLFGSRARTEAQSDSDYDLLVVVATSELPAHRRDQRAYRALKGTGVPKDVLVWTGSQGVRWPLAQRGAVGYACLRMVTDAIHPSGRLALTHPTTRLPDYPTTRLPRATSRSANLATADRSAPVLSAARPIRVAHSRHASVRPATDSVGRLFHQSTPTCVATLAGRHHAWRAQACPFGAARGRQRRYGMKD